MTYENIASKVNEAIISKTWILPLSSYTQANCQVSLTDKGYRIYRSPNAENNNNTWGGLRIYNEGNMLNLQKGHTYICKFSVTGQTSNGVSSIGWTNQMGWGGGGLNPNPTNVEYLYPPANFKGTMECYYKWTLSDDVYKVCTSTYSSFTQGQTYLSYRDFMCGWGYSTTGELGTDIYITNFRLYDITNGEDKISINKQGLILGGDFSELKVNNASIQKHNTLITPQFIEI